MNSVLTDNRKNDLTVNDALLYFHIFPSEKRELPSFPTLPSRLHPSAHQYIKT